MRRVILGLCHVVLLAYPQRIYINEVMFDAVGADHHTEFVELYNADTVAVLMTGMRIGDAREYDAIIPPAGEAEIVLPAGHLLLILDASYAGNATDLRLAASHNCRSTPSSTMPHLATQVGPIRRLNP
jgi:hypothetical protein